VPNVGKGHGNRISKPPSAKQKQHAEKYAAPSIALQPSDSGLPADSWWTQPVRSRADFDTLQAEAAARMRGSRFGRLSSGLAEG
jgi:hypothetical protein